MAFKNDTKDIQRRLLKILLSSKMLLRQHFHMVKPEWFTSKERKFIYEETRQTFEDSRAVLTKHLFDFALESKIEQKYRDIYLSEWNVIGGLDINEAAEALMSALQLHQTGQKTFDILQEAYDALTEQGDVEKAVSVLRSKTVMLGTGHDDQPIVDITEHDDLVTLIKNKRADPNKFSGIKTGFHRFDNKTGGLFKAELTLIAAVTGVGKCSSWHTTCYSKTGTKTIKQIWEKHINQEKTSTTSEGGEWYRAISEKPIEVLSQIGGKLAFQKVKGLYRERANKLATLKLRDNSEIEAGLNHGYLTQYGWKKVKDLRTKKDWIAVASKIDIPEGEKLNEDLVEFLAWHIGEGHDANINSFNITQSDRTVLENIKRKFNGLNFVCSGHKHKVSHIEPKTNGGWDLCICSKEFNNYLKKEFGYEHGYKSHDKIIPKRIQNCHQEIARKFLRDYWDAEGCCKKHILELTSKSKKLIESLRYMLRRFGILVLTSSFQNQTKKGLQTYWKIQVGGKYARIFKSEIGFGYKYKKEALERLCAKPCKTNIGDSVPCGKLLQEFLDLTKLSYKAIGLTYNKYTSSKIYSISPLKNTVRRAIGMIDDILNSGLKIINSSNDEYKKRRLVSIELLKQNRSRIIEIRNKLEFMSSEDITWLEIKSVKKKNCDEWLYDLEMEGEPNYVLDLAISHNSTLLKQLGWTIMQAGKNVLHITNEESCDQVRLKYHSLMTEVPYLALKNPHLFNLSDEQIEQYDKKLAAIKNNSGYGKLEVKEIPQFSDASLIERAYVELQNRGINIDVIIVDLLDHMMPVVKAWGENDEQAKAAADLKGLAIICEVPVLAATQASTEAENKQDKGKKFGKMDVYGSKRKVHATNTLIYIVQAHQDESQLITSKGGTKNKIDECDWLWNIQIAKNRDGDLFSFEARHHVEIGKVTQVAQGLSNAGANSPIQKSIEELKEEEVLANEEAKKSGQAVTEAEVPAEVPKRAFHKKTKIS